MRVEEVQSNRQVASMHEERRLPAVHRFAAAHLLRFSEGGKTTAAQCDLAGAAVFPSGGNVGRPS